MNTPQRINRHIRFNRPNGDATDVDLASSAAMGSSSPVIDTVGHTQQVPVTKAGTKRPEHTATPSWDAPNTSDADEGSDVTTPGVDSADGLAESAELSSCAQTESTGPESALELSSRLPASSDASMTAIEPSKSMVTTELVAGLRNASRHLSRPSASEGHLRTELTIAARRIDSLVRANGAHDDGWAIAAMSLVHDAGCALEQRRITDGWQLLRAAQTEMLDGLDHRSLAVERANITGSALVVDDTVDTRQLRSEVWAIRQTKNTYSAELNRRLFEAARGLFHRAVTLLGVIALGAVGVLVAAPAADSADALGGITAYLTIVGLGMTGAAVSQVLFTNSSKRASAISEVANPLQIVMLRLAFGGVAGLLVVVLLQSEIQNLINVTAISAYPWAILGGFGERYVDRVIDRVESDAHTAASEACRAGTA